MSLFGAMRTSVSGMNAQSFRVSTVADNIANTSTTGYKRASTEFETVLGNSVVRDYASGGVVTQFRHAIDEQGTLQKTSNATDLAVEGNGFFIVQRPNGAPYLTRAGSFVPDGDGKLVNTAGYALMGYDSSGSLSGGAANGLSGLQTVNINQLALVTTPTTEGLLSANLPSTTATIAAAQLPSANAAGAQYSAKTSLVTYDNLGAKVQLDVYYSKTGTNAWEMSVYDASTAASGGGFPYSSAALTTSNLTFDSANGKLATPAAGTLNIAIPNGQALSLNIGDTTQLAANFGVAQANTNGNAPSSLDHVEIGTNGVLAAIYKDGTRIEKFRIPLAQVVSPDNLLPLDGNVFAESLTSGAINVGTAGQGALGSIMSSTLEGSTVDLGGELTTMIEAQRSYSANSKVFQAGSDMIDVLMNLKV